MIEFDGLVGNGICRSRRDSDRESEGCDADNDTDLDRVFGVGCIILSVEGATEEEEPWKDSARDRGSNVSSSRRFLLFRTLDNDSG